MDGSVRSADWPEIFAFSQGTRLIDEPWEIILMGEMTSEFVAGFNSGKDVLSISPYDQRAAELEGKLSDD